MSKTRVTIIIPNYNGEEHLERLLSSITDQTWHDYEVTIIDDCSPDRAAVERIKMLIKDRENMRLVENEQNLGFVKTCNKGFRLAAGDYVCILTNDTKVERDFVERNVQILDADCSIGVLSCVVVDQRGNNWFSGGLFRSGLSVNLRDDFEGVRTVDWVAGTACFYRREVFDSVGFLDETLIMYHEDIDFCLRVRSHTHYRACMFGEKLVTHHLNRPDGGAGVNQMKSDRVYYYLTRNDILLVRKHCRRYLPAVLLRTIRKVLALAYVCLPLSRRMSPRQSAHAIRLVLRGARDGLSQKTG
jgi:GT2 family glycosyltransferase